MACGAGLIDRSSVHVHFALTQWCSCKCVAVIHMHHPVNFILKSPMAGRHFKGDT